MNVTELRNDLLRVYQNIENKKIGLNVAKEKANIAGKVLGSAKVELEYNKLLDNKNKINFLEQK
jgi:hypothetical protein